MSEAVDPALSQIVGGTSKVISEKELEKQLKEGRPLRIKFGVDPTAPDIHLGHTVPLEKLRQFQEMGHQAILLIGDFTATVGDPTGRSTARPPLTREEVLSNAETYTDQAFKVLDREKTEIIFNGEWFRKMSYESVLKLNARVTLQQMLQREDFKERVSKGTEVRLHELQYPIMQGWDSVELQADVEIGGTDQLFNMLVGRDLQKEEGQTQQSVICMPLLEGLDGVKKMSKSAHNYVGVSEPPNEMFGKLMSISDDLMDRYYLLLLGDARDEALHPMEAKKELACRIVARYHSEDEGEAARGDWETRFSKRDLNAADLPEMAVTDLNGNVLQVVGLVFKEAFSLEKSNGELRKQFITTGAVQLDGDKLIDPMANFHAVAGQVLRLSKKQSIRLV
ncbi:MAG: tyrosine--tRNA ligase [Verrucomicrobia bacterium]|jgi:tyrosyl-tRNA synthetase|nr:tyrosine--tRNA ligase [Verrucomicrobiota bacterium]MDA7499795.1 tyrosine--tRNA ligase [Akkermansiaceae bacterium]MDA7516390.1 tyrosine--tRNA ligase [bacterium]MBT7971250.1 tyrosine--tRNA ligase [Verrucomicrobiota bacterium]MDA7504717.1 tyrosine--tRNA ligase [Akkermansiaceae bacterium]